MDDRNRMPQTASAPDEQAAQPSSVAPKKYVVNNGFDKVFFIFSLLFIAFGLFLVISLVSFAIFDHPEAQKTGSVPDFVNNLTGNQCELVVRKLGPMDDNLFRTSKAYVLVRTDADIVSNIEHMAALNFKFVPLESPELETDKMMNQVYDSTAEIDKVYEELVKAPPGADCRYFVTRDDPDYSSTYLCFSPETKLLLVVRTKKKWSSEP